MKFIVKVIADVPPQEEAFLSWSSVDLVNISCPVDADTIETFFRLHEGRLIFTGSNTAEVTLEFASNDEQEVMEMSIGSGASGSVVVHAVGFLPIRVGERFPRTFRFTPQEPEEITPEE